MAFEARVLSQLVPQLTQKTSNDKVLWRLRNGLYQTRFVNWDVACSRSGDIVTLIIRDNRGRSIGEEDIDDDRARALHDAITAQTTNDPAEVSLTQFISNESLDRVFLPVTYQESNVTANQTTGVVLGVVGSTMTQFPMARAGSLMSVGILLSQAVTAGLLRIELTRNGTDTGVTFDVTSGYKAIWEPEAGKLSFTKGQELGVKWGSSAALAPTGFELNVFFEVQWIL